MYWYRICYYSLFLSLSIQVTNISSPFTCHYIEKISISSCDCEFVMGDSMFWVMSNVLIENIPRRQTELLVKKRRRKNSQRCLLELLEVLVCIRSLLFIIFTTLLLAISFLISSNNNISIKKGGMKIVWNKKNDLLFSRI
jgi:hypothetical protein